jgi:hypothetical protein
LERYGVASRSSIAIIHRINPFASVSPESKEASLGSKAQRGRNLATPEFKVTKERVSN